MLRMRNSVSIVALGSLWLTLSCGRSSGSNALCTSAPSAKANAKAPSSLNLDMNLDGSANNNATDVAIGTGFIDIDTKNEQGQSISRRCTMSIRPIDASNTVVRVWTAGHCAFEPQKAEFKNAKYTLQVYHKGGYFTVPAEIDGFAEFAKFAQSLAPYIAFLSPEQKAQVFSAIPTMNTAPCLRDEATFRASLGSQAKNIACFTRGELRGLKTTITLNATTTPFIKEILASLRARETAALKEFSPTFKKVIATYHASHFSEVRRRADLRSFALSFNQRYCDAANAATTPAMPDGTPVSDARQFCQMRPIAMPLLAANLSPSDLGLVNGIINDTTSSLETLVSKSKGCNGKSDETITAETDIDSLTPCDLGNVQFSFWRKWVDQGTGALNRFNLPNPRAFGLSPDSYFTFTTNSQVPSTKSAAAIVSKARILPLNTTNVLNFGIEVNKTEHFTILINYDRSKGLISPRAGDSGSILSIFGVIPAALLSTVDGEGTSGGAAITPLPNVGDDEDATPRSGSGC